MMNININISKIPKLLKCKEKFILTENLTLEINELIVEVSKGFETDLASVPIFLRHFIKKEGKSKIPSIFHDWLYYNKLAIKKDTKPLQLVFVSKLKADWIFFQLLNYYQVKPIKSILMLCAVVIFGTKYWSKDD